MHSATLFVQKLMHNARQNLIVMGHTQSCRFRLCFVRTNLLQNGLASRVAGCQLV